MASTVKAKTPASRGKRLYEASKNGNLDDVHLLLALRTDIEFMDEYEQTPLFIAASNGHTPIVERLLDARANMEAADVDGQTPLFIAASNGHTPIVERLLDARANMNAVNNNGQTPLYIASSHGHTAVVERLLAAHANKEIARDTGHTPLSVAALYGHMEVVQRLLDAGANIETQSNKENTPLLIAAMNGHKLIVEQLLAAGADINKRNKEGNTANELAAENGHHDIVKLLSHPIDSIPYKLVFVSVDNTYDVSTIPDEFDQIVSSDEKDGHLAYILDQIKRKQVCGGINKPFIEESLRTASFFVYLLSKTAPITMEGMVIVNVREDSLYIDVICGSINYSGVGTIFIDKIIKLARIAHKHKVTLSSLAQSLGFYIKKGFECNDTCPMKFVLQGGARRSRKRRQYKRKTHKRRN